MLRRHRPQCSGPAAGILGMVLSWCAVLFCTLVKSVIPRRDDPGNHGRSVVPHNSLAFENANDVTLRVFSSRISVRVIGGSARWLQFSRSQSRQLTPIGVPSALSRFMPAA